MIAWRGRLAILVLGIAPALALSGCASEQVPIPPPKPVPIVAFDGVYRGAVEITYVAPMAQRSWCETESRVTLTVEGGKFTYTQPHPAYPGSTTPTYYARIAADGTITGDSDQTGTIRGKVSGTRMTATVNGLACAYSLTADRT